MPTYEYECQTCGVLEIFQSMKEDALTCCPDCGSKRFQKLISGGAGVIFKGSGFYETDYNRSADYQKQADGKPAKDGGDSASGSGSEKSEKKSTGGGQEAGGSDASTPAAKAKPAKGEGSD